MTARIKYSYIFFLPAVLSVIYFSYLNKNHQLDDALIYLRYIKHFSEGYGLVYNKGERFNGLTSPLFTYIMLIYSSINSNLQLSTISMSAFFMCATCILSGKIVSITNYGAAFTAFTIASFGYFYSTFGMETTLFLFLIVLTLYLYKIESDYFIISLSLLLITRNEAIFLAIPIAIDYLTRYKKLPSKSILAVGVVIFTTPFIFNYVYYGGFFPSTANAKIGQGQSGFWGTGWLFFDIDYLYDRYFSGSKNVALLLLVASIYGASLSFKDKTSFIFLVFIVLLLCFYSGLNIPNYHWYYAPFLLCMLIYYCYSLEIVLGKLWLYKWPSNQTYFSILIIFFASTFYANTTLFSPGARHEDYAQIGMWLNNNTSLNSTVAMIEIGTVGWYSERHIIDILGLTNKYNAEFIAKGDVFSWLSKYQPDYILRHDPPWPLEESGEFLEQEGLYSRVSGFIFPGYVLLEKNKNFDDARVAAVPNLVNKSRLLHKSMFETSKIGPPHVEIERMALFSHAPNDLMLVLPDRTEVITLSYGVKVGAQGKHHGVCFEIIGQSSQAVVFNDCIYKDAMIGQMRRRQDVRIPATEDNIFVFRTRCIASCDFAWSYWGHILPQ